MEACPGNGREEESTTVTVPIATVQATAKNNGMGNTRVKQPVFIFSGRWVFVCLVDFLVRFLLLFFVLFCSFAEGKRRY